MATRIKDGMIPYTWWIWIEITNNHVINVLLRELNNLIHVNEDRELYVDLQLDDWIQPDDDFPVGVTTWKILQEDWWQQSWIILNWKTTSWDYVRFIYANDGKLYYDPWTWVWIEIWAWWGATLDINTKTFWISNTDDLQTATQALQWRLQWKFPVISYQWNTYLLDREFSEWDSWNLRFINTFTTIYENHNSWDSYVWQNRLYIFYTDWEATRIWIDTVPVSPNVLDTNTDYQTPYTPQYDWSPATKKYVDDWLALKQDKLTAWTRITIDPVTNVISADVSGVMTYMWNVTDSSQLPASWNQGDCWYDETAKTLRAWDWNRWNDIGGTGIDLTNYFNMTTNTSDDITEWTTNLFVTQTEKNTWNSKQDQLTAWTNIQISNNVISATDTIYTQWDWIEITNQNVINNTAKFDPDNAGSLGQFLKKTNDGYAWADIPWWWGGTSYTAWDWIDITNNVISATDRFTPTNQWSIGQVLKKSGANTYYWANESWWGGWGWNFNPTNTWTPWQILTKTSSGYAWMDAKSNVKCFDVNFVNPTQAWLKAIADWVDADETNWAIIKTGQQDVFLYSYKETSGNITQYHFFSYRNRTDKTTTSNGDFTSLKQVACTLSYNEIEYSISAVDFNTVTNFLVVESSWYTTPYMPTAWYQPATKAYVDSRNWVWTLSEYNNLPSIDPNVFYNITSLS